MEDTCIKGLISYSGNRPNNEKKESQVVNKLQPKFSVLMVGYIMTWYDLVNKGEKAHQGVTFRGKKAIDDLMSDGVKRTAKEILNDMWDVISHKREIPSKREIHRYVAHSDKYDSGYFDIYTDKPTRNKDNWILKYWLKGVLE